MKFSPAMVKSYLRSFGVALAMALVTYSQTGAKLGANKETFLGIGATLLLPLLPVVQRYLDKTDPAFGAVAKIAIAKVKPSVSIVAKAPDTASSGS